MGDCTCKKPVVVPRVLLSFSQKFDVQNINLYIFLFSKNIIFLVYVYSYIFLCLLPFLIVFSCTYFCMSLLTRLALLSPNLHGK